MKVDAITSIMGVRMEVEVIGERERKTLFGNKKETLVAFRANGVNYTRWVPSNTIKKIDITSNKTGV